MADCDTLLWTGKPNFEETKHHALVAIQNVEQSNTAIQWSSFDSTNGVSMLSTKELSLFSEVVQTQLSEMASESMARFLQVCGHPINHWSIKFHTYDICV